MFRLIRMMLFHRLGSLSAIIAIPFALGLSNVSNAAVLHVVYAVDARAENVGEDVTAFEMQTAIASNIPREFYREYIVPRNRMSEPEIIETVRRVNVQPDDTLMFVYVGHGAWREDIGTFMTPSASVGQELSSARMLDEVNALRPRLGIVIFDCCNKEKKPLYDKYVAGIAAVQEISPLLDELFFRKEGLILLESSSPNEYAFVRANKPGPRGENEPPRGPLFMSAFGKTLRDNKNQRMEWSQFADRVQFHIDRYLEFMKNESQEGIITLSDGTRVDQERQTVRIRFYR